MRAVALQPVGAEITELAIPTDPAGVERLKQLLAGHGVLILPGQPIGDAAFVEFLAQFGELTFTTGETPVSGFPDLNLVSNVGRATPPRSSFHVDTSYVRSPPAYTALRAVTLPAHGGETLFTDQYRAYETLPADVRRAMAGRTITHVATGVEDDRSAEHPVFRLHPISGRTALYMSTPARCAAVSGMGGAEAAEMIKLLYAHSTQEDNIYRHTWSSGDIVIWDNACVLHRADHADVAGERVLHRGMVGGLKPTR